MTSLAQIGQAAAAPAASGVTFDPVTITLIGGMIVTIIGTLATAIVSIITALRVAGVKTDQATTAAQLFTVAKDTEAIKGHVNSEKTASEERESALKSENAMLRELVAHEKTSAGLLAQAAAQALGSTVPAPLVDKK